MELINFILSIAAEKNYTHISWNDKIKSHWIIMSIENLSLANKTQDNEYFASLDELEIIFGLNFNFKDRDSIKNNIKLFGKKNTWKIIKYKCNEDLLDLLY